MGIQDLLITPLYLAFIYLIAYQVRPLYTNKKTLPYFIPALTVKIIGAIAVGLIYQFYYGGGRPSGDTFMYFKEAKVIYDAFFESPWIGIKLLLSKGGTPIPELFIYSSKMYWFRSPTEYFVIRMIAAFGIFTFYTYSSVAVLFATLSFSGVWALYRSFCKLYPRLYQEFAIAILFVPSVFFWGSGILKDTITLGALGWAAWAIVRIFFEKKGIGVAVTILLLSLYTIYSIKIYILLCFVPAAILWVFIGNAEHIRSPILRILTLPVLLGLSGLLGYFAMVEIGEDNAQYSLDAMLNTAEVTATYLAQVSERQQGSGYTLGDDYDFSPAALARKFPLAVNVTLFRPYLWEAYNPVMLLSALESFATLVLTLMVVYKAGPGNVFKSFAAEPVVTFCLVFAIMFSFAIGVSTYNFGSLVRYKIPMLPFYLSAMFIIRYVSTRRVRVRKKAYAPPAPEGVSLRTPSP